MTCEHAIALPSKGGCQLHLQTPQKWRQLIDDHKLERFPGERREQLWTREALWGSKTAFQKFCPEHIRKLRSLYKNGSDVAKQGDHSDFVR